MLVDGKPHRTIWLNPGDSGCVQIIDQRALPHQFVIEDLRSVDDAVNAIADMHVRGAPLIGATAAWGIYLAAYKMEQAGAENLEHLRRSGSLLKAARPTAVNLAWAVDRVISRLESEAANFSDAAKSAAEAIAEEDIEICRMIGVHGLPLIEDIANRKHGGLVNILTHCNAGWRQWTGEPQFQRFIRHIS